MTPEQLLTIHARLEVLRAGRRDDLDTAPSDEQLAIAFRLALTDVPALLGEVERLCGLTEGLAARVAAQSELLARSSERRPP